MKKIIFALASILSISSVYAASYNWSFDAEGNAPFNGATYFAINDSAASYASTLSTSGYTAFISSLVDGNYTTGSLDVDGIASGTFSNAASEFGMIVFGGINGGESFYYVTTSTSGYTYDPPNSPNGIIEVWAYDMDGNLGMLTGTIYDAGTGGGSQGDVPEPTVLALLALGVAGVALRRKVA